MNAVVKNFNPPGTALAASGALALDSLDARTAAYAMLLSDVDFLRWALDECEVEPRLRAALERELRFYDFSLSDEAYRAHYLHHEGKFYAGPVRKFIQADWTREPRYQVIREMARSCVARGARRFLDFGCSTGHISRTLAREFPQCEFVGVDVVPQALSMYNTLAPSNARATWLENLGPHFDVIICAEVLEHVREPTRMLNRLATLGGDPQFICTLPQGPWESRGWSVNHGAREHLRHWDQSDLLQIFGPSALMTYVGGVPTELGIHVGHVVTLSGPRVGTPDMPAKLRRYGAASAVGDAWNWIKTAGLSEE